MAERARVLVACVEPLVQAGAVEPVGTRGARNPRQSVVGWMQHRVADGAHLHAIELAIHVALPEIYRVKECAVLQTTANVV